MAGIKDWVELARSTILSLETRDVRGLYNSEWPETKRVLTADHRREIEGERRRLRRELRTGSAILFGLTKRLAPARRILFVSALFLVGWSLLTLIVGDHYPTIRTYGALAVSFGFITLLLGMEIIDKIKFRDELVLARELQAGLIPQTMPQYEGFEIAAFNRIANTVGGDIYDFVPLADGRLAVLFGDASGHGMAAGLIMAVAHAAFRTQLEVDPSPRAVFTTLNRILCRTGGRRSFFAGVYLLLEPDGKFEVIVAGHPPVLHIAADGSTCRVHGAGAYPLGIKNSCPWVPVSAELAPGETLVVHSDGLLEARNVQEDFFGDERIQSSIRWCAGRSAPEVLSAIVGHWQSFAGEMPIEDDVSIGVLRRVPVTVSMTESSPEDALVSDASER